MPEGLLDGLEVGGCVDGEEVEIIVGKADGVTDGIPVGSEDGPAVGFIVDGSADGWGLGRGESYIEGMDDG